MQKILKKENIAYFGSGLFVLLALFIMFNKPFQVNLNDTAHLMLGGIMISLGIWIFKPFDLPYSVGGFFLGFFGLSLGLKPAVVFSGLTQTAIWILIPALFFGFVLQKTGLGRRIAIGIIKLFKPSYVSLVFAWVLIGIVISLMTPSSTVRIAIMIPIAAQCCELCRLVKGSKGNSLIILTAFGMAIFPGMGWLSGSLWGPIISGMINSVPETEGLVTFYNWFTVLFVPLMVITLVLIVGGLIFLKPKEKLPPDALDAINALSVPKISKHEIITLLILASAFVMFLTHGLHGIPDAAVCLAAVFLFFLFGILEAKDFNTGINWDLVLFIAMALSFGAIFNETGLSTWFAGIVVPLLAPVAGNPYLFMFSVSIFVLLWKFLDVALFIPTTAILVPILPSIQAEYQISPLVWMFIFIIAANSFILVYQNIWALMTKTLAGEQTFTKQHLAIYGIIYFVACFIALLVAIPMWINAGLFG